MSFDIRQLDNLEEYEEEAFEEYQGALLEHFAASPEGQARLEADPEMGFFVEQLIYYGYNYVGVTLPKMNVNHLREVVTDLFPRKISLLSPDDADDAIPELIAFWQYLKREYKLPNASAALQFLRSIEPDFRRIMNDPSKFGMAKSFFMMGQSMGFDMTDEAQAAKFINIYNARILAEDPDLLSTSPDVGGIVPGASPLGSGRSRKEKRKRKMAKASRRKNRGKRK